MIAHEMGHAASQRASQGQEFKGAMQYCYPSDTESVGANCNNGANNSSGLLTNEWGPVQFEEGMATFLGMVGAFWYNGHQPIYCTTAYSSSPCPISAPGGNTANLEQSTAGSGSQKSVDATLM